MQEQWFDLPTDQVPFLLFGSLFCIVVGLVYYVENRLVMYTAFDFSWRWKLMTIIFFFAIGWVYAHQRAAIRLNDLLHPNFDGKTVELTIAIDQLPNKRQYGFRYDVMVIDPPAGIPSRLRLNEYNVATALSAGSRWKVAIRLYSLHGQYNPHAFDYERWLFLHGFGATGTIQKRLDELEPLAFSLAAWRSKLLKRINNDREKQQSTKPPESVAVLGLGIQTHLHRDAWSLLKQSGTIHLFSISGLHVTMLALLIGSMVATLWKYSTRLMRWLPAVVANQWAMLITAWSYALISGMGLATQRTVIMLTIVFFVLRWGIYTHWSNIAAWALLVLLLIDPWAVLAPGFWLSFTGVCVLLIMKGLYDTHRQHFQESTLSQPVNQYRFIKLIRRIGYILLYIIRQQLMLSLALMPLMVIFFAEWPIAGLVANLLAVPWVSWLMVPLSILMVIVPHPFGFAILAKLQDIFFNTIELITTYLAAFPVTQPSTAAIVLSVLGLLWLLMPRGIPMRWLGLLLLVPLLYGFPPTRIKHGQAHISILDVGSGLATVIRTQNHTLIYDTGAQRRGYSTAHAILRPFLYGEGIRQIDRLIVSHADNDHAGGMTTLQKYFPIHSVTLGDVPTAWPSAVFKRFEACPMDWYEWRWDAVHFAMMRAPVEKKRQKKYRKHENNASCILKVTVGNASTANAFLLTGDIERKAQEYFITYHRRALKSDYVLAPHHGSATSAHATFFQAVSPRYLLVSGGARQRHYPAKAVMQALAESTLRPIIRHTWFDGAIQWILSPRQMDSTTNQYSDHQTQPTGFRERKKHYWQHAIRTPYIYTKYDGKR